MLLIFGVEFVNFNIENRC